MSTPRRTNSRRAPKSPFTSPGADEGFGDNDDEAERMAARRAKAANERARNAASPFKSPGAGPKRSNSRVPPQRSNSRVPPTGGKLAGGKLTEDAMMDIYTNCIKLSADNKISTKNTWGLSMIDHMQDMVTSSMALGADGNMNFQMASGAVEAGVKIYSSRVDSVATEAYKVLSNLSRANNKDGGEDDAAGAEDVDDDAEGAGPRKRKIRSGGCTLETNPENLNLKDLEYQITTDPLFQKTSASFDEGGAKGMLLNNLNVQNGCQIVFDSSDAIDEGTAVCTSLEDDELELGDLAGELNDLLSSIGDAELTPGFTQFRLGHTKSQPAEQSLIIEEMPSTFDSVDDAEFVDDGADFDDDDDGAGAPYDGDLDGPAEDDAGAVDAFSSAPTVPGAEEPLDFPLEMMAQDGNDGMRGDFRDSIFGANWAGPGGTWKHTKDKADGTKDKKKAPKEKFVLDFSVQVPDSALACAAGPTAFTLSAAALENNTEESTTMPEDLHYQLKELCTLFTKPSVRVGQGQSAGDGGVGSAAGGDAWYDYSNENDMENFCPDLDAGGVDDDDECGGDMGLDDSIADESGMIGAPQLVGDTKINYARAAKKVDVHLLKESIWDTIEDKQRPLSDATNKSKRDASVVHGFQTVISGVNDHVPEEKKEMLKDVSVPFCFICLLHLANEKNLVLTDDKLGRLARLDIGPDGSDGEGTGSCDWATASKSFDKIAGKSGAVRAS